MPGSSCLRRLVWHSHTFAQTVIHTTSHLLLEAKSLHISLDIFDLHLVELVNQHASGSKLVVGDADGPGHFLRADHGEIGVQADVLLVLCRWGCPVGGGTVSSEQQRWIDIKIDR